MWGVPLCVSACSHYCLSLSSLPTPQPVPLSTPPPVPAKLASQSVRKSSCRRGYHTGPPLRAAQLLSRTPRPTSQPSQCNQTSFAFFNGSLFYSGLLPEQAQNRFKIHIANLFFWEICCKSSSQLTLANIEVVVYLTALKVGEPKNVSFYFR